MHKKKKKDKLSERNMDPVLLVHTSVPGGVGNSHNKDKGIGRTNVETGNGKSQLGFSVLVSK